MTFSGRTALSLIIGVFVAALPVAASASGCHGVALADAPIAPFAELALTGDIPDQFNEIVYDFGDELVVYSTVGPDLLPAAPVYLPDPMVGGTITARLAGTDAACDLGSLQLEPLPPAPGTLATLAAQSSEQARAFEAAFGLSRSPSGRLEGSVSDLPAAVQAILLFQEDLDALFSELDDDPYSNAVLAQISAVAALPAPPVLEFSQAPAEATRVAQAWFGAEMYAGTGGIQSCPVTGLELAREIDNGFQAWAYATANSEMFARAGDASGFAGTAIAAYEVAAKSQRAITLANSVSGVAGTTALAGRAAFAGKLGLIVAAGAAVPTLNMARNDVLSKMLLIDMEPLDPQLTRTVFYEDAATAAELAGRLTAVNVVASSRGGDIRSSFISVLTSLPLLKGTEYLYGKGAGLVVDSETALGMKDNEVFLSIERRECTVNIEGPNNVVTRIVPPGYPDTAGWMSNPPVRLVDPSSYRAVDVGKAQLMVSTVAGRFGANNHTALVPLEVLELQLSVNPDDQVIQPGDVADVSVTVRNSSDPLARVSSTVLSGAVSNIATSNGLDFVISSQITPDTFPIVVKFEPTIKRGLMLRPNAPDRFVAATIQTERLSISAPPFCLEAGQDNQFTAAISPGEDSVWPAWSTDYGSIDQKGLYTAPADARGQRATVTAYLEEFEASVSFQVGACTCFWDVEVGGRQYSGYYAFFPILFDPAFDRDGDGVINPGPLISQPTVPGHQPIASEIGLQSLMINYPREEAGPAISLMFDPPLGLGHGESNGVGSITSEVGEGIRTDLTRTLRADNVSGTYWLNREYVDVLLRGDFSRSENGQVVESRVVLIRARARAGYAQYSACAGPDAPLPGGWLTDALPAGLPQLPMIER